ncbi:MAG TPA: hypothetical protein VHG08_03875 [Longimicrobium sp.]|nr:hypothetical protein [Longimicrobium sp.]
MAVGRTLVPVHEPGAHPNLPQGFLGEVGEVYEPGGGERAQ